MQIKLVKVQQKFNLGNYQSLSLAAEAELNEKDNPLEAWNILRDNIEMCFTDMQRKRNQPTQQQKPQTQPKKQPDPTVCPVCGGKKKPEYQLCYNCYEKEKAGGG